MKKKLFLRKIIIICLVTNSIFAIFIGSSKIIYAARPTVTDQFCDDIAREIRDRKVKEFEDLLKKKKLQQHISNLQESKDKDQENLERNLRKKRAELLMKELKAKRTKNNLAELIELKKSVRARKIGVETARVRKDSILKREEINQRSYKTDNNVNQSANNLAAQSTADRDENSADSLKTKFVEMKIDHGIEMLNILVGAAVQAAKQQLLQTDFEFGGLLAKNNIWARGFYGSGKDNSYYNNIKYRTQRDITGLTAGANWQLKDDMVAGLAVNYATANSQLKLGEENEDSEKLNSVLATIYTHNILSKEFSLITNFSFGRYHAEPKDKATKYKGDIFHAAVELHHKVDLNEYITFTPNIGVTFDSLSLNSPEENIIPLRKFRPGYLVLTAGLRLATKFKWQENDVKLAVYCDAAAKGADHAIDIGDGIGQTILSKGSNVKSNVKFGGDLAISFINNEITIGGFRRMVEKSENNSFHTIYIKLKLNF